jgi:Tol biopolymer transport system component
VTSPVWTPDGKHVVYWSARSGIMLVAAEPEGRPRSLLNDKGVLAPWSFQSDGGRLAYQVRSPEGNHFDLWTVPLEQSARGLQAGTPEPFLTTPAIEVFPTFSPDGKWMAYLSNRSGAFELYIRPFPNRQAREIQLSHGGAMAFRWPAKGQEIFYRTPKQKIMSLRIRTSGGGVDVEPPKLWSDLELADTGVLPNFEVTPEGRRVAAFLTPGRDTGANRSQVTFAVNFFEELRRRLEVPDR